MLYQLLVLLEHARPLVRNANLEDAQHLLCIAIRIRACYAVVLLLHEHVFDGSVVHKHREPLATRIAQDFQNLRCIEGKAKCIGELTPCVSQEPCFTLRVTESFLMLDP